MALVNQSSVNILIKSSVKFKIGKYLVYIIMSFVFILFLYMYFVF